MRWACALVLVVVVATPARGQDQFLELWTPLFATAEVVESKDDELALGIYGEVQPRMHLAPRAELWQLVLRTAGYLRFERFFSVWAGYGWTPTFNPFRDEQRPWQQFAALIPLDERGSTLELRARLEERFIAGSSTPSVRLRLRARLAVPITEDVLFVTWEEPFFTFNRAPSAPAPGLDENRFFLGAEFRIDRELFAVDVGYLDVYRQVPGAPDQHLHGLWVSLYVSF